MILLGQGFKVSQAEEISKVTGRFRFAPGYGSLDRCVERDFDLPAKFIGKPPVTD